MRCYGNMFYLCAMILPDFLQQNDIPLVTALVLGLIVAVNPCQLAINISALSYLSKKELGTGNFFTHSLLYAFGRILTYTILGWVMICLIGGGRNVEAVMSLYDHSETIIPFLLLILGIYLLVRGLFPHKHHSDDCHNSGRIIKRNGPLGAIMLGIALAFAFCPESAVCYFGLLLPLSVTSSVGLLMPLIFAIGAALPVAAIAWTMNKATNKALAVSSAFERAQQIINIVMGVGLIGFAIYLFIAA